MMYRLYRFAVATKWWICVVMMMEMNATVMVMVVAVAAVAVEVTLMEAKIICIVFVPFNVKNFVGLYGFKAITPFAFVVRRRKKN